MSRSLISSADVYLFSKSFRDTVHVSVYFSYTWSRLYGASISVWKKSIHHLSLILNCRRTVRHKGSRKITRRFWGVGNLGPPLFSRTTPIYCDTTELKGSSSIGQNASISSNFENVPGAPGPRTGYGLERPSPEPRLCHTALSNVFKDL